MQRQMSTGGTFSGDTLTFNTSFSFLGDQMVVPINRDMSLVEYYSMTTDFTSKVHLSLPTGVTFTSESGVFANSPIAAVPEPETYAMLLAGLGLMGAFVRRRKQK
jgi:hypothetical protein